MQTQLLFETESTASTPTICKSVFLSLPSENHDHVGQQALSDAEQVLLDLANHIYAHTSLKPMSKTLFLISRCLLVARRGLNIATSAELAESYANLCSLLGTNAPIDDFDFHAVLSECGSHIDRVLEAVRRVATLTSATDSLGLAFNTLLRGKFESGEGLGTFLTPEEVVDPMVRMLLGVVRPEVLGQISSGKNPLHFGDICGGTGRFVYSLYRLLNKHGLRPSDLGALARLFDQSSLAVEFGRLNFLFEDLYPRFECVGDSLTAQSVSKLRDSFALLATNPPFGIGKYRWTQDLASALSSQFLGSIGLRHARDLADPSELFLFRNMDLLAPGGALAIVLPDGVIQSRGFLKAIRSYENIRETNVSIVALVSLPVATFSLGGTVAKTSFLILRKSSTPEDLPLYVALAKHVGFVKRGNRRFPDPRGNELVSIANEFLSGETKIGVLRDSWRALDRLVPTAIFHNGKDVSKKENHSPLKFFVDQIREFESGPEKHGRRRFHVSILDVDQTGLMDIISATQNQPVTKALRCQPGDILVSCINPKIWRVSCVPKIEGTWTCSPEFLVLRPKKARHAWRTYLALHSPSVLRGVQSLAGGTSSSRQRVEKDQILNIEVPVCHASEKDVKRHANERVTYYMIRLRESAAYNALHGGRAEFSLSPKS